MENTNKQYSPRYALAAGRTKDLINECAAEVAQARREIEDIARITGVKVSFAHPQHPAFSADGPQSPQWGDTPRQIGDIMTLIATDADVWNSINNHKKNLSLQERFNTRCLRKLAAMEPELYPLGQYALETVSSLVTLVKCPPCRPAAGTEITHVIPDGSFPIEMTTYHAIKAAQHLVQSLTSDEKPPSTRTLNLGR